MSFLLFIISLVLRRVLEPVIYLYGSVIALFKGEWHQYNMSLAIAIDQYGNGLCQHLFNQVLITKLSTHKFGNIDETISSVLGKNKLGCTLTIVGKIVDKILDTLDPDHSIKSIDHTEN